MDTQAKHTPTPWYARKRGGVNSQRSFIHTKVVRSGLDKGKCRVIVDDVSHLDAEFIVKACNSYEKLSEIMGLAFTLAAMATSQYKDMIEMDNLGRRLLSMITKQRKIQNT